MLLHRRRQIYLFFLKGKNVHCISILFIISIIFLILFKSITSKNCLVTHILQNTMFNLTEENKIRKQNTWGWVNNDKKK